MLLNARKKLVAVAVASTVAGGAALLSAPAQAMNVSQDNLGQVMFFPYYTVKNGFDTLIHITNTSDRTAIFKIRWREALNSREVRDFNVILSPYDVWTASVTKTGDGNGALVRTFDSTCTSPILPPSATVAGAREVEFTTSAFDDTLPANFKEFANDGGPKDRVRTQEGYFEVFLMGASARNPDSQNVDPSQSTNIVEYNAKHVNGTPRDCAKVDGAFTNVGANFPGFVYTGNILKGASALIAVNNGSAVDQPTTHIEHWTSSAQIFTPGDQRPTLADGNAPVSVWFDSTSAFPGAPVSYVGNNVVDRASAMLSSKNVINEYAANGTGTFTDWIVTFPTKHHYTDLFGDAQQAQEALAPFAQNFNFRTDPPTNKVRRGQSCDAVGFKYWDRNEKTTSTGTQFSPAGSGNNLCYEVNVITFNGSNVFGDYLNHKNIATTAVGTSGWMNLSLTNTGTLSGTTSQQESVVGLPVIGFAAIMRQNASEAGNNRNYGTSQPHSMKRRNLGN